MSVICVIVGPTSAGKTSIALDLCKKFGGEIISADSRQVYKHMDIGTGKLPTGTRPEVWRGDGKWVVDGVVIHGYDLVEPGAYFSAYDWAKWAALKIRDIRDRNKKIFVVGGTGFYVDVLVGRRILDGQEPDHELRRSLETITTKDLHTQLMSLNREVARSVDENNRRRIIRALEKELAGGTKKGSSIPYLRGERVEFLGLTAERKFLYEKADGWIDMIWEKGLIEETRRLVDLGFGHTPQLGGLVYKSVRKLLAGDISEGGAKQEIKFDLHAYIRRQLTWFKKNEDIRWFDVQAQGFAEKVYDLVSLHR